LALTQQASALPLVSLSASAYALYGKDMAEADINPYGPGLSLRAGVTFPLSLHLGLSFDHFFGEETGETLLSDPAIDIERSAVLNQLLGHVGYDLDLIAVLLRPSLGVGQAWTSVEVSSTRAGVETVTTSSDTDLVLSPAVEARFPIALLSACAQLRYDVIFRDPDNLSALVVGVGVGLDL
jgi:hypothetical protein